MYCIVMSSLYFRRHVIMLRASHQADEAQVKETKTNKSIEISFEVTRFHLKHFNADPGFRHILFGAI